MKTILFLIDSLQTGGAEKSVYEITQRLKLFKPVIVTLYSDKKDLKKSFDVIGIKVYSLNISRRDMFWFFSARSKFNKILKRVNPHIVHAHLFKSELVARRSKLGTSLLVGAFVNDSYAPERYQYQSNFRNLKLNFVKLLDRLTIGKSVCVTSITRSIAISNCKALKYDLNNVEVISRGRRVDTYHTEQPSVSDTLSFLVVGRLLIRKGYLELISAVDMLVTSGVENFKVTVAGDGADKKLIISRAKHLIEDGFIEFLGTVNNIPGKLHQAHAFILPSHYEGQGGALVEAMQSAKPIIVSDIAVFKEQVTDNFSAKLFRVGDAKDLASKMEWMIHHLEEGRKLGKNAREYAEGNFDIEKIAAKTEAFYQKVINSTR